MDRSTLGERASHGQIYLRRESQPWTDLPDERASHGQIYLMRARNGQIYLMGEPAIDRLTI